MPRHRQPEIFTSEQGSQFTSTDCIKVLAAREIKINMDGKDGMDGKGAWRVARQRLRRTPVSEHQL